MKWLTCWFVSKFGIEIYIDISPLYDFRTLPHFTKSATATLYHSLSHGQLSK